MNRTCSPWWWQVGSFQNNWIEFTDSIFVMIFLFIKKKSESQRPERTVTNMYQFYCNSMPQRLSIEAITRNQPTNRYMYHCLDTSPIRTTTPPRWTPASGPNTSRKTSLKERQAAPALSSPKKRWHPKWVTLRDCVCWFMAMFIAWCFCVVV